MALDDIAKEQHVDVALEQLPTVCGGQILGFRKSPGFQIIGEMVIEGGALASGEGVWILRDFFLMVPQEFAETKRVDRDFPGAPPH